MGRRQGIAAMVMIASTALIGCGRDEPEVPPAQIQTESVQRTDAPTLVTGCLRAGETANTFVLTTAQAEDGSPPATYQLHGSAGVNLADHVGRRIEVNGVVREQAQIATRDSAQPAGDRATGTAGTPTVQTGTQLTIRQLEVTAVQRAGGDCEQ